MAKNKINLQYQRREGALHTATTTDKKAGEMLQGTEDAAERLTMKHRELMDVMNEQSQNLSTTNPLTNQTDDL